MAATPSPISSRNANAGLWYLLAGKAHDGTDGPRSWFTSGLDCMPATAEEEWRSNRERWGKAAMRVRLDDKGEPMRTKDGNLQMEGVYVQAVHLVISYDLEEYDPNDMKAIRTAHEQSLRVAELVRDGHKVIVATQTDGKGGKVHSHIYVDAIHPETGRSASGRNTFKNIDRLRGTVDAVSLEYGRDNVALMEKHARSQRRSPLELKKRDAGQYVWKDDLSDRLETSLADAIDREDWKAKAEQLGVAIKWRGKGLSYGFTDAEGEDRWIAAKTFGSKWRLDQTDAVLERNAQEIQQMQAVVVEAEESHADLLSDANAVLQGSAQQVTEAEQELDMAAISRAAVAEANAELEDGERAFMAQLGMTVEQQDEALAAQAQQAAALATASAPVRSPEAVTAGEQLVEQIRSREAQQRVWLDDAGDDLRRLADEPAPKPAKKSLKDQAKAARDKEKERAQEQEKAADHRRDAEASQKAQEAAQRTFGDTHHAQMLAEHDAAAAQTPTPIDGTPRLLQPKDLAGQMQDRELIVADLGKLRSRPAHLIVMELNAQDPAAPDKKGLVLSGAYEGPERARKRVLYMPERSQRMEEVREAAGENIGETQDGHPVYGVRADLMMVERTRSAIRPGTVRPSGLQLPADWEQRQRDSEKRARTPPPPPPGGSKPPRSQKAQAVAARKQEKEQAKSADRETERD